MASMSWRSLSLAVQLSAFQTLAVVDQNQLNDLVQQILSIYRPSYTVMKLGSQPFRRSPMFSLVVSVPFDYKTKTFDIYQLPDQSTVVNETMIGCNVYTGQKVVGATVLRWPDVLDQCLNGPVQWIDVLQKCPPGVRTWRDVSKQCDRNIKDGRADHAEYRTIQHMHNLLSRHRQDDLMLFFVYASPCPRKCTNKTLTANILQQIQPVGRLKNFAFVFSKVFRPRGSKPLPAGEMKSALTELGSTIGLQNIFRCDNPNGSLRCVSCSSGREVTPDCYVDQHSGQQSRE